MASKGSGRLLWWIMRGISWLPLSWVAMVGGVLGRLMSKVPLKYASAYRVVLVNLLATHPRLPMPEIERIGQDSLEELGRTFTEFAHIWCRPPAETLARITRVEGEAAFLAACADSRPVLLLSLHQGSWETSNIYLGDKSDTVVMYQPHPAHYVDAQIKAARERTGSTLIPTNAHGVKAALSAMRQGGTLALLADHNPGNRSNPFIPFFGHLVPTPALVDKLVQRFRPHVFVVACLRGPGGVKDLQLQFMPAPEIEQATDETAVLCALNDALADSVRRCPTQYQWTYKRFKRAPQGRRPWYKHSQDLIAQAQHGASAEQLGLAPVQEPVPSETETPSAVAK